jgi:methionyl aminopeptidase
LAGTHGHAAEQGTICTAVNEEVVHGIPGPRRLRDGDIVGIDVRATLDGWVGDVGAAIQELAEHHGYGVVRELGGHGVGHALHEEPHINHFGRRDRGLPFREGMAIEPMINEGTPEIRFLEDGWTVVTADNKLSAQYEHTIALTSNGCEILTLWHLLMSKTAELA